MSKAMATNRGLQRRHLLYLLAALPAACTSPNPTLYTLAAVPGPTHVSSPSRVELQLISLAHYLDRSQIVRASQDYRLEVLGNDWWGEPLDSMLSWVLVQELSQRLPASIVYSENGAITATPDASVQLNILQLDQDRTGALILQAQVAVTGSRKRARNVHIAVPVTSSGTAALVAAMSSAVGRLADVIAGMLT